MQNILTLTPNHGHCAKMELVQHINIKEKPHKYCAEMLLAKHITTIIQTCPNKYKPPLVFLDGNGDVSTLLSAALEDNGTYVDENDVHSHDGSEEEYSQHKNLLAQTV